jgi:hypothetical protein
VDHGFLPARPHKRWAVKTGGGLDRAGWLSGVDGRHPLPYLITAIATPATRANTTGMTHPQHSPPTFRCLPERVHGMPVARPIRDFAAEMPRSRFQENPP